MVTSSASRSSVRESWHAERHATTAAGRKHAVQHERVNVHVQVQRGGRVRTYWRTGTSATRAESSTFARERHQPIESAFRTPEPREARRQTSARHRKSRNSASAKASARLAVALRAKAACSMKRGSPWPSRSAPPARGTSRSGRAPIGGGRPARADAVDRWMKHSPHHPRAQGSCPTVERCNVNELRGERRSAIAETATVRAMAQRRIRAAAHPRRRR